MADDRDLANGFQRLDPVSDVGDSYAHSPCGADSRGPMKNWRSVSGVCPQQTDIGEKTHPAPTGSYEGHARPHDSYSYNQKLGANEPPKHGRQDGKEIEKDTDLGSGVGARSSVGGGQKY